MMPSKSRGENVRLGARGVRVPGHVGRWRVAAQGASPGEFVCESETFPSARRVMWNADERRSYVIIREQQQKGTR